MSKRIDQIEQKIDLIATRLGSIDVTLASQHESLKDHIRRTEILENKVTPIEEHVNRVSGAFKLLLYIGSAVGFIAAITEILTYLGHK